MSQLISRRDAIKTGLLASGALAVLPRFGQTASLLTTTQEEPNKAIVGRWFSNFWGKTCNLGVVDELAAPPRRGRSDIKAFMTRFPRGVSGSQLLGRRRFDRRGRLCGRQLGRRRYPHRSRVQ
jgi:hypothetical protein